MHVQKTIPLTVCACTSKRVCDHTDMDESRCLCQDASYCQTAFVGRRLAYDMFYISASSPPQLAKADSAGYGAEKAYPWLT